MIDQANKLRDIIRQKNQRDMFKNDNPLFFDPKTSNIINFETINKPSLNSRVITITSGKGGVGKTNFTVNLAIQLKKLNKKVVIIDADFGLANIEILFGKMPKYSIADVLNGNKSMEEVLTPGPLDIQFISGGSGLSNLADITQEQMSHILDNFNFLDAYADIILIDTGAGISKSVINFIKASTETIIMTTPEPTSITDAYSIIKTVKEKSDFIPEFKLVVNRVDDAKEGEEIFLKLSNVSEKFLDIKLKKMGSIPYDNFLIKAVKQQIPVSLCYPNSTSSKSIELMSNTLLNIMEENKPQEGIKSFMKRLVNIFGN